MRHAICAAGASLLGVTFLVSCSSPNKSLGPRPRGEGALRFAIASGAAPHTAGFSAAALQSHARCTPTVTTAGKATVITCGGDVLTLNKVSLVLREIELERAGVVTCDATVGNDDCEEVETGPMRFDVPLGVNTVAHVVSVSGLPPGTYDELEFEIHRPSPARDAAFVQSHPDLAGISIRAEGTFSRGGAAARNFVYTSDLEEEEEEDMLLTVPQSGSVGVTLQIDVAGWFMADGGLVDPEMANDQGEYESDVRHNIRESVKAFQDNDQDGVEDD
jgi:hypothetical protein